MFWVIGFLLIAGGATVAFFLNKGYGASLGLIGLLMIRSVDKDGNPDGKSPLKQNGHACAAKVKVVPLRDRLTKHVAAEIVVDADCWKGLRLAQQRALIDHELEHLVVVVNKLNEIQMDDAGHPKLKCKPDSYALWGFPEIAKRHGLDSGEVLNAQALARQLGSALGIAPGEIAVPEPEPVEA